MTCRACHHDHSPLERCEVARRKREATVQPASNDAINTVIDTAINMEERAINGKTPNRRTREDYNAYMRDYMRKKRNGKSAPQN